MVGKRRGSGTVGKAMAQKKNEKTEPVEPMRVAKEILETPVEEEIKDSFLAYSLSVITSRAIPDVRDGLKPVQRRILYALDQQNIRPTGPYKKCARVVGETMGKYHPHGDSAIYDALVRLAQPFSMRLPLVDGHGNFGSPDDPPAAQRYTECRMSPAAADMLAELGEDTVDMRENYDGTEIEPAVLPSRLPNLLLNGSAGIAVGMATNIAPHNLGELIEACLLVLEDREIKVEEILKVCPGPDFPTGGVIVDGGGIKEAYVGGRGAFKLRAKATVEQVTAKRQGIVITELPYTVGPERFIERCKNVLNNKGLEGVADIKDLSDRKRGMHLVVECKVGVNPQAVLAELYTKTPLEESFSVNAVVLDGGKPVTLGIVGLLARFLDHRLDVVERRSAYRLQKAEDRAHIVEGLVRALANIDEVVAILKASREVETARKKLIKKFSLSEVQAGHILDMPLRRLTGLEVNKLKTELKELQATIKDLKDILAKPSRRQEIVKQELVTVGEQYQGVRRSTIVSADKAVIEVENIEIPDDPCRLELLTNGNLRRKAGKTKPAGALSVLDTTVRAQCWGITKEGKAVVVKAVEVPEVATGAKTLEVTNIDMRDEIVSLVSGGNDVVVATEKGVLKKLEGSVLREGSIIALKEGDRVVGAVDCKEEDIVLVTTAGQLLRTTTTTIRAQGRTAGGVAGIKLGDDAKVITVAPAVGRVWTISDTGAVKATLVDEYPVKGRGGIGVRCMRFRKGETCLTGALVTDGEVVGQGARGGFTVVQVEDGRRDGTGETTSNVALFMRV